MKMKKRGESVPALKRKAWKIMSVLVRKFHADDQERCRCVTCQKCFFWNEVDAGHFISKNKGGRLWFEWRNIHPQCGYCNRYLHGNQVAYTLFMVERYGLDEVQRIQSLSGVDKKTRSDYLELIEHLKECEKEL